MRKDQLVATLAVAAVLVAMVGSAQADGWFVVQHSIGMTTVTDRAPGVGWSIVAGPYATEDAAIRASGVGDAAKQIFARRQPVLPNSGSADWGTPAGAGSLKSFELSK